MRVRMVSGVKHVTVIGPAKTGHVVVREQRRYGAADKLKYSVIRPMGQVERGELRLDLGPVKRNSRALRPVERRLRKLIRAEYKALQNYLVLHDRSSRKRRNGWAKDFNSNMVKVIRRS